MASFLNISRILTGITLISVQVLLCASSKYDIKSQFLLHPDQPLSEFEDVDLHKTHELITSTDFRELFSEFGIFSKAAHAYLSPENLRNTKEVGTNISSACQRDTQQVINGLFNQKEWSLRMVDAAAKIPAGILYGNFHWVGSFDECRAIKVPRDGNSPELDENGYFKGQYCTAGITLSNPNISTSKMIDTFIGRIKIGYCVPDSCAPEEAKVIINTVFRKLPADIPVNISTIKCTPNEVEYDTSAIAAIAFFSVYAFIVFVGTVLDLYGHWKQRGTQTVSNGHQNGSVTTMHSSEYQCQPEKNNLNHNEVKVKTEKPKGKLHRILLVWSLYSNCKKLLSVKEGEGTLECINGIRFLSISWIALAHTYMYTAPLESNRIEADIIFYHGWLTQLIANSSIAVDTFFTMSGLLLSYLLLKDLKKNKGKMNWVYFYVHRYWRLTTPYMLILFFYATLFKYTGNGPLWNPHSLEPTSCSNSWWYNLLYVNNFVDREHRCFSGGWYLANEMQFFILSPLFIVPLFRFKYMGVVTALLGIIATMTTTGVINKVYNLPPTGFRVLNRSNLKIPPFDVSYIKPYCRIGPYIVGILTGYILYKTNMKCKINRFVNVTCWIVVLTLGILIVYGMRDDMIGDLLPPDVTALYAATHRTVWGVLVCWVIFSCVTGHGGFVNTLLSWKVFLPLSRLTYIIYLINPMVIYFYLFSSRTYFDVTPMSYTYTYFSSFLISIVVAAILSMTLESPLMGLEKVLLKKNSQKK